MKKACLIICLMAFATIATADTIVFQDGLPNAFYPAVDTNTVTWDQFAYQGTHDNYVSAYGSSREYNMGQSQYMAVGSPGWYPCQEGLLKFDLSAMAGATITGATLDIWARGNGYGDQGIEVFEMYAVNGGWVEGSKAGAPASGNDSTWNNKDKVAGTTWAGGYGPVNWANPAYSLAYPDYDHDNPIAGFTNTDNDATAYSGYAFALPIAMVQSWIVPDVQTVSGLSFHATADGLTQEMIDAEWWIPYESPSYVTFLASDYASGQYTYSLRPKLTLEYTPEPMTLVLLGLGGLFIRRKK